MCFLLAEIIIKGFTAWGWLWYCSFMHSVNLNFLFHHIGCNIEAFFFFYKRFIITVRIDSLMLDEWLLEVEVCILLIYAVNTVIQQVKLRCLSCLCCLWQIIDLNQILVYIGISLVWFILELCPCYLRTVALISCCQLKRQLKTNINGP